MNNGIIQFKFAKWDQIADLQCSSFSALLSPYADHNNKNKYKAVLLAFQIETEFEIRK